MNTYNNRKHALLFYVLFAVHNEKAYTCGIGTRYFW